MNSVFNILDYGAVADSITNNAKAIQQAIDEASVNGGQVFVPAGTFLSGTIRLKSNIDFHLSAGAVLLCSCDEMEILSFRQIPDGKASKAMSLVAAADYTVQFREGYEPQEF